MKTYNSLTIKDPAQLLYGTTPKPLTTRRGLVIGGGDVYPELNFTLPTMRIAPDTIPEITQMYSDIIDDACKRAIDLHSNGFVVEFETLPEMTIDPLISIRLTATINEVLERYYISHGLKTALRITPNDTREMERPPKMRSGAYWENMLIAFEGCAKEGAELLAIESTGGKEIHDEALLNCDISQVIFALSIMGCRDMDFLWGNIVKIAQKTGTFAAGDTACGFGNTAMVLADRKYIPAVFAAVVRAVTAVRSLVAYEKGAVGPGKDCGYENPILKAITGFPMAMEGKSAACAHLSPVGNIPAATCDLWSNESVQNIKLLGGMAPTVYLEQLEYDCRLFNTATHQGKGRILRDLLVDSDAKLDAQAYILSPVASVRVGAAIVTSDTNYHAAKAAAIAAIEIMREGYADKQLNIPERELGYLDMMADTISGLPADEGVFIDQMMASVDQAKFQKAEYNLK